MNLKDITREEKTFITDSLQKEINRLEIMSRDDYYSWEELKKSEMKRVGFNTLNNQIEALKKMIKILGGK